MQINKFFLGRDETFDGSGSRNQRNICNARQLQCFFNKFEDSNFTELVAPQPFTIESLNMADITGEQKMLANLEKKFEQAGMTGTNSYRNELNNKIKFFKAALQTSV
jgi:hypothetical protein